MRRITGARRVFLKSAAKVLRYVLDQGWKVPVGLEVDDAGIIPPRYVINPRGGMILALQDESVEGFPELEFFMRSLAAACGIKVTAGELVQLGDDTTALLYELPSRDCTSVRTFKSRIDEIESYDEIAKIIADYTDYPMFELQDFLTILLFAYVTGNCELKAEDFVLEHRVRNQRTCLGPAHGFFPGRIAYEYAQEDLALEFGTSRSDLTWDRVLDFGRRFNLSEQQCRNRVLGLKAKIEKSFDALFEKCPLPEDFRDKLKPFVYSRLAAILPA